MFDAHTHLNADQLYPDREQHVQDFMLAWWTWLINIWVNDTRNQRALDITKKSKELPFGAESEGIFIWATIGLHPGETTFGNIISKEIADHEIQKLQNLYKDNKQHIVALGECGIDSHFEWNKEIEEIQTYLFIAQCELARKASLPIVIHSRDNFELTHQILSDYKDLDIYFHCRWYTAKEIEITQKSFWSLRIWFCGNLTYPKAHTLRESFEKAIELDISLVLETDAPYLAPQVVRGRQNIPAHVSHLYTWVQETYWVWAERFINTTKALYKI